MAPGQAHLSRSFRGSHGVQTACSTTFKAMSQKLGTHCPSHRESKSGPPGTVLKQVTDRPRRGPGNTPGAGCKSGRQAGAPPAPAPSAGPCTDAWPGLQKASPRERPFSGQLPHACSRYGTLACFWGGRTLRAHPPACTGHWTNGQRFPGHHPPLHPAPNLLSSSLPPPSPSLCPCCTDNLSVRVASDPPGRGHFNSPLPTNNTSTAAYPLPLCPSALPRPSSTTQSPSTISAK